MAKFCEVCKQPYPDEHVTCPRCAARAEVTETAPTEQGPGGPASAIDLDRRHGEGPPSSMSGVSAVDWTGAPPEAGPQPAGAPESAVDLGGSPPPAGPQSGESDVAWAALAEEPAPHTGSEPAVFDAPSDADLRARAARQDDADPSSPKLASDQEMARDLFAERGHDEVVELGHGAMAGESDVSLDEALDLEVPARHPSEGGSGRDLIAEEVESGVDLEQPSHRGAPEEPAMGSGETSAVGHHSPDEPPGVSSAVDLGSGDVNLPASKDFGRDLPHAPPLGSEEVIDLEGLPDAESPSGLSVQEPSPSAVDLGSRYDINLDDRSANRSSDAEPASSHEGPESGIDLGEAERADEVSGIDLGDVTEADSPSARSGRARPAGEEQTVEYEASAATGSPRVESSEEFVAYDESLGEHTEGGEPGADESAGVYEAAVAEEAAAEEAAEHEEPVAAEEAAEGEAAAAAPTSGRRRAADRQPAPAAPPAPIYTARGAWLGGTLAGLLLGVLTCVGLSLVGIWPDSLRSSSGTAPGGPSASTQQQGTGGPSLGPGAPADAVTQRAERLRQGDLEGAAKAGIEQAQDNDPRQLAQRGEYRWLSYLQKQRQAGQPLRADDPAVKAAVADLSAAGNNNPDALFWLGHIQEMTNQAAAAQQTYKRGAEAFRNDRAQRARFQAALERLQMRGAAGAAGAMRWSPTPGHDRAVLVAALLSVALQQPSKDPPPEKPKPKQARGEDDKKADTKKDAATKAPPAQAGARPDEAPPAAGADEEAGEEFWKAVRLAREQNYGDAIKAIDQARSLHDRRRFLNLRRAQNPITDPTEEIFLRSCDELKSYWQMEERLKKGGYLAAGGDPVRVIDELTQKAAEGGPAGKLVQAAADRLIKDKVITGPEDLDKGVEQVLTERRAALTRAADLDNRLKASRDEARELASKLKETEATAADQAKQLRDVAGREAKLKDTLASVQKTVTAVVSDLREKKWLDPAAGTAGIPRALAAALKVAAVVDPQGRLRSLEDRVQRHEAELGQRWRPEEMLGVWLPLLDNERGRRDLAERAAQDAERVRHDERATEADRARADVIRGLALRNEGRFDEAKAALEQGLSGLRGDRTPFVGRAETALREASDPGAWLAQQARQLYEAGRPDAAAAFLNRALEFLPAKDQPAILAQRSLLQLDAARARARGRVPPADPMLEAARKDAADAARTGLAEGFFAAGRVAEEMGRLGEAAENYRKALAAHRAVDADGSRYRMALARVLLTPGEVPVPAAPPPAGADKATRLELPAGRKAEVLQLAVLLSLAVHAPAVPPQGPGQDEAERLADEVLKAPAGAVPFNVRAQAYAVKGLWTRALITYAEGLRSVLPPVYAEGLLDLVNNHPRLARPDGRGAPDLVAAEKDYADGVNFFFDGDYASAERALQDAVANNGLDARYHYFLGLARLALGKTRQAQEDFDQGAALERLGRPGSAAVSAALERVQGPARQTVNEARARPR
jgi:hypothetical protein